MAKLIDEPNADETERAAGAIREHVMRALGRGSGSGRVRVWRLWEGHYRVNVYAGSGPPPAAIAGGLGSVVIAHSFFVVADPAGTVLTTIPALPPPR